MCFLSTCFVLFWVLWGLPQELTMSLMLNSQMKKTVLEITMIGETRVTRGGEHLKANLEQNLTGN